MLADSEALSGFAVDARQQAREFYGQTPGPRTSSWTRGTPAEIAWFRDPAGHALSVLELE